jgi:hypothetical protein
MKIYSCQDSDSIRAGSSGDRIPVLEEYFPAHPHPEAQPALCTDGTGSFLGIQRPERGAVHASLCSTEVTNVSEL